MDVIGGDAFKTIQEIFLAGQLSSLCWLSILGCIDYKQPPYAHVSMMIPGVEEGAGVETTGN